MCNISPPAPHLQLLIYPLLLHQFLFHPLSLPLLCFKEKRGSSIPSMSHEKALRESNLENLPMTQLGEVTTHVFKIAVLRAKGVKL